MNYIIGHKNPDTDAIVSSYALSQFKGSEYKAVIAGEPNNETKFIFEKFGVQIPEILSSVNPDDKFVLTDHNEASQIFDGITSEQIIEIVDHHKLNVSFSTPITITTKPYGSASSIVTEMFIKENKEIDSKLAGLLLGAILSDTVIFKSPTTTEKDKEYAEMLAKIAGIENIVDYGMELFKKKSDISTKTANELINGDFKDFDFNGKKVGIGQIELIDSNDFNSKKDEVIAEMENIKNNGNYFAIIFAVTDIMKEGSYFFVAGNEDEIYSAFEITKENNYKAGVLSRKKQIVPVLQEKL